jgi:hypothetical protein
MTKRRTDALRAFPLKLVELPQPQHYRDLFRLIGARWLWFSRLIMDDAHRDDHPAPRSSSTGN